MTGCFTCVLEILLLTIIYDKRHSRIFPEIQNQRCSSLITGVHFLSSLTFPQFRLISLFSQFSTPSASMISYPWNLPVASEFVQVLWAPPADPGEAWLTHTLLMHFMPKSVHLVIKMITPHPVRQTNQNRYHFYRQYSTTCRMSNCFSSNNTNT